MLKKLLKEPLIHFLAIGLGLFILFSFVNEDEGENRIVIDQYDINELVAKWKLQWQREPTPTELKGLLDAYIKEEILYLEALSMNLDHNDEIIKRRLAQKMEFLTQDIAENSKPSDEELLSFLNANSEKYRKENRYSFEHIYFSPDKREDPLKDASLALANKQFKGDNSPLRSSVENISLSRVRSEYGKAFAMAIDTLQTSDNWQGPVVSGLGVHLVKISSIEQGGLPELNEIRTKLINDFNYDLQQKINEEILNSLLDKYEIVIDVEGVELEEE